MPPFAELILPLGALFAFLAALHALTTGAAMDRVIAAQDATPAIEPETPAPDGFTRVWTTGHPSGACDCLSVRRRGNETEHYRRLWFWQTGPYFQARWIITNGVQFGGWYALNPIEWLCRLIGAIRPEAYGQFPIDPSAGHVEGKIPVDAGHGVIGDADVEPPLGPFALAGEELHLRSGQSEVHFTPPVGLRACGFAAKYIGRNIDALCEARAKPSAADPDNAPLAGTFGNLDHAFSAFGLIKVRPGHSHLLALPGNDVLPDHQYGGRSRGNTGYGIPIQPAQIHSVPSPQVDAKATGFSAAKQALADLHKAQEATALIRLISAVGSRDGLLALALVASMVAAAPAAQAGPYVGVDIQGLAPFYRDNLFATEPQHFGGGDVHVGWRQGIFALEGGWAIAQGGEGDNRLSLSGLTLDALVYSPVRFGTVEPFLTVGTANLLARSATITRTVTPDSWSVTTAPLFSEQNWDWRAGAGLEWGFTQALRGRLTARYEDFTFTGKMHGGVTLSFGINVVL